ncbi:MAG: endonuclease/exonuclease/phosphatase family protein [archaeon]|nr:endonuclease/exonuclease/phosphatase family protein [archaeon]
MIPLAFVEPPSSSPSSPLGLVLATTHLYWDPQNEDVKHAQAEYLLHRMDQWMGRELGEGRGRFPLVLAGDFNSLPSSSVYRFITEGHISATDLPAWTAAGAPRLKDVGMDSFAVSYLEGPHCHGLSLKSAYGARAEGEPGFTNYTPNWQGTIDYIFFSPPLRCGSVLPFPSIEEVSEEAGGLPNSQHASDHLPLLAELFIQ